VEGHITDKCEEDPMARSKASVPRALAAALDARGTRHNNPRDLDVEEPLGRIVAVVGVSGSGKTLLAIGRFYAEGAPRFLEIVNTHCRRLTQAQRPVVIRTSDSVTGPWLAEKFGAPRG
jgi:hypothetical protein